jgi:hypothetical protein
MSFFGTFEQELAAFAKRIVGGLGKAETVVNDVEKAAPEIEMVSGMVFPAAAAVEQVAFGLLAKASTAISGLQAAASAGGINITLDETELQDLKSVVSYLKSHPSAPTQPAATVK